MSERAQGGLVLLGLGLGLFYAFWSGALEQVVSDVVAAVTSGGQSRQAAA